MAELENGSETPTGSPVAGSPMAGSPVAGAQRAELPPGPLSPFSMLLLLSLGRLPPSSTSMMTTQANCHLETETQPLSGKRRSTAPCIAGP